MIAAEYPGEAQRIETLRQCHILDTPPEETYDRITHIAAELCATPVAVLTLVDERRQWFKAEIGLGLRETARDLSFCAHTILEQQMLVVKDALLDPRFADNALVIGPPGIRFYAGVPLFAANGHPLGSLAVIDLQPRELAKNQLEGLALLAREVETQLALRRTCATLSAYTDQRAGITAMVVHDMNNPLSVAACLLTLVLERPALSSESRADLEDVRQALGAVQGMTSDLLDVTLSVEGRMRPRLTTTDARALFGDLAHAANIRALATNHTFSSRITAGHEGLTTDAGWLGRVVANLVDNACKYSPRGSHVTLEIEMRAGGSLRVQITDEGPGVPAEHRSEIFDKHFRLTRESEFGRPGTGLGLAFCKLAVETLGGRIGVEDTLPGGSSFWFEIPRVDA